MYKEEFTSKLAAKFRAKNDDDRNAGFKDDLILFSNICPEKHLQDVYNWISLNHKYSAPFMISKIFEYAKSQGYIQEGKKHEHQIYWYRCENGHNYQYRGSCCPVCGSRAGSIVTYKDNQGMPTDTILIQDSCAECEWYHDDQIKPVFGLYGASCQEYGTEKRGTIKDYCNRCKCIDCCKMEYYARHDRVEFEKMMGKYLDDKYTVLQGKFKEIAAGIGKGWGK